MQLAAAQAEEEERTQAAAEQAPVSIPEDPAEDPAQPSGQSQHAPGQQPVAPEQAGQALMGLQPTAPQPAAAPVRKSVRESGSRSTLRFAEAPTIATMSEEEESVSGTGRQPLLVCCPTYVLLLCTSGCMMVCVWCLAVVMVST